jgi:hypothetical protein
MCHISLKLYKAFQCHSQNVYLYYSSTHTSHLHCTSRHITTFLLWAACKSISTAPIFSFSISKVHLNSSTSAEFVDVSSSVNCSRYDVWYSYFLLSSFSFWYSCGSYVCEDNIKWILNEREMEVRNRLNWLRIESNCGLLCTGWRTLNKSGQCLSAACLSMFHHTVGQLQLQCPVLLLQNLPSDAQSVCAFINCSVSLSRRVTRSFFAFCSHSSFATSFSF